MVVFSAWALPILACIPQAIAAPSPRRALSYQSHPDRTAGVQQAFQTAWDGYYKYAYPHDNLLPISDSYVDDLSVESPPNLEARD
jgi:mannosyl-oligosaccharide alpha-1,2-mannosidase